MPKKKVMPVDEPLVGLSRPQRNMRAKKVFDPSDNYLPKRRNKPAAAKLESPIETSKKKSTKKKNTKKKTQNQVSKSISNVVNESLDCIDITISPPHSPSNSVEQDSDSLKERSDVCFLCTKALLKQDLVDCPICLIKAHKNCLIVDEPIWKFKLDKCTWLCRQCRKKHCSKCLEDESDSDISRRCVTCKVGLHFHCYNSYDIKPLHTLQINMYVCIPCMTLAIHKIPEEEDEEIEDEELEEFKDEDEKLEIKSEDEDEEVNDEEKKEEEIEEDEKEGEEDEKEGEEDALTNGSHSTNGEHVSSDEEDDLNSNKSYDSLLDFDRDQNDSTPSIPDISNWSKYQVYEYLTDRLPKDILSKIIKNDIDGHALQLLKRTDVTVAMGLKLGPALQLYKEIRILQSQSTYHGVFWE